MRIFLILCAASLLCAPTLASNEETDVGCSDITINKVHLGMTMEEVHQILPFKRTIKHPREWRGIAARDDWECEMYKNEPPDKGRFGCFLDGILVHYQTSRPDLPNVVMDLVSVKYGSPTRTGDISTGVQNTGTMGTWEFHDCNVMLLVNRAATRRFGKLMMTNPNADSQTNAAYDTEIIITTLTEAIQAAGDFLD